MDWEEFLRNESDLLTLVGTLGDPSLERVALKVVFSKILLGSLPGGALVPRRKLLDILEDLQLRLSEREALDTLVESGLVKLEGAELRIPENVSVERAFLEKVNGSISAMPREHFIQLLSLESRRKGTREGTLDLIECAECIDRTTGWGIEVAAGTNAAGLPGVPVFWTCEADHHTPFSPDPGTLTTGDTLLLIVERTRYAVQLPELRQEELDAAVWLWHQVLSLQRDEDDWNTGAFNVPSWDDDFVGAYQDKYRELGPCPTVDATGNLIVALTTALGSRLADFVDPEAQAQLEHRTRDAISHGIGFLLRCQLDDGAWPIYRYEGDHFPMPARDLSCRFAVEALSLSVRADVLNPVLKRGVRRALRAYLSWLEKTARWEDVECHWVPNFTRPFARDDEKVQATATIGLTLTAVGLALPEAAEAISRLRSGACAFVQRVWQPNPDQFARIAFRVPTWEGPADTQVPWELPADPVVVSMLLTAEGAGINLEANIRSRITAAISNSVNQEVHGHWVDFLMKKEGKTRAMPGNTLNYHRALLDYFAWQARVVERRLGGIPRRQKTNGRSGSTPIRGALV